jgi:RHS repeat-associated protein
VRDIANNTTGASIDHLDYDGFGNATESESSNGDRYKFTGAEWDKELQLQHNDWRYYSPATGRWISQDPTGFDARDSNLYRYVANDPTNAVDPTGLDIIVLLDSKENVALAQGHIAVLIGQADGSWKYRSFLPEDDKPYDTGKVDRSTFESFDQAKRSLKLMRYTNYARYACDAEADAKAIKVADSFDAPGAKYIVTGPNCVTAVQAEMKAAGITYNVKKVALSDAAAKLGAYAGDVFSTVFPDRPLSILSNDANKAACRSIGGLVGKLGTAGYLPDRITIPAPVPTFEANLEDAKASGHWPPK